MKLIFDLETDGLLKAVSKIHTIVIKNFETKEVFRFRCNDEEDTILDAIDLLSQATVLIGHNILHYDLPVLRKLFEGWDTDAKIDDTLVIARQIVPDLKNRDFARVRRGILPAAMTGSHSLKAWGMRLGMHKGDYADEMKKLGLDPWKQWSQEMEDYCALDVDVTEKLYENCLVDLPPQPAIDMEHDIHDLVGRMERNGFPFDREGAEALANKLRAEMTVLHDKAVETYGYWYAPAKKWVVRAPFELPKNFELKKPYKRPRAEYGEDYSRAVWGDVFVPKKTINRKDPSKPSREAGVPFCPVVRKEFNPGSRDHVIDRLTVVHDWEPVDFTETGRPKLDEKTLKHVSEAIPMAADLAELFFVKKLLGMIAEGAASWLNRYDPDTGAIHASTNTAGAVTRRCSHFGPNIAQVPKVLTDKKKNILYGRAGKYGYECRQLFHVYSGFKQVGVDLAGIELRCLANLCAEFDNGELIQVVLGQDPHQYNMDKTGVESRDIAKRLLYALMYGAGDFKLGFTAYPGLPSSQLTAIGKKLRGQFMEGLPALEKAIAKIKKEAAKGYLHALDDGKVPVRAIYSSLNTRLQSDAAVIAKRWAVFTELNALDNGWQHDWSGDFAMLAFIHDELQNAVRDEDGKPEQFGLWAKQAAIETGLSFGDRFVCPVAADAKLGYNWGDTH